MNEAAARLVERIETNLKVTDAPGMDIRFTMDRDAAMAFVEQLRATDQLLTAYERLRAALDEFFAPPSVGSTLDARLNVLRSAYQQEKPDAV